MAEKYPDLPNLKQLLMNKMLIPKEVAEEAGSNHKGNLSSQGERASRVIVKSSPDHFMSCNRAQMASFLAQLSSKNADGKFFLNKSCIRHPLPMLLSYWHTRCGY